MTLLSQPKIAKNGLYSGVAAYQIRWAHTRLSLEAAPTTMREEGDMVKTLDSEQFQQGNIFSGFILNPAQPAARAFRVTHND